MLKKLNTFSFDYYSEMEQKQFEGKFTARIASMMDKSKISTRRSQICGGMYCVRDDEGRPTGRGIDEETELMAHMMAWLEIVLVQKPTWFKLEGEDPIVDDTLIMKVFEEVMRFENSFRGRNRSTAEGADGPLPSSEGTGETEPQKANAGNGPKKVVDQEIPTSLDA